MNIVSASSNFFLGGVGQEGKYTQAIEIGDSVKNRKK